MKLLYEASNFTIQARWVIPFAILGIIGVLLLLCSRKPFFKLLAAVCLVICAIAALRFCFGYVQVIQAYKQGNYKSVEGYVENFIPASSGGEDQEDMEEESFDIKGVHFSYGDKFIKKFGYHRPSTQLKAVRLALSRCSAIKTLSRLSACRRTFLLLPVLMQTVSAPLFRN